LLLAAQGVGVVGGSLSGARRGGLPEYKQRYVLGAIAVALGMIAMAVFPVYGAVLVAFAVFGIGNGLQVVHERLIFQLAIPQRLMGRAFALLDSLGAWAFAIAYLVAGLTVSLLGPRGAIAVAAGGVVATTAYAAYALKTAPDPPPLEPEPAGAEAAVVESALPGR
jgi:MFS family permease